jgi:hypothetical protein
LEFLRHNGWYVTQINLNKKIIIIIIIIDSLQYWKIWAQCSRVSAAEIILKYTYMKALPANECYETRVTTGSFSGRQRLLCASFCKRYSLLLCSSGEISSPIIHFGERLRQSLIHFYNMQKRWRREGYITIHCGWQPFAIRIAWLNVCSITRLTLQVD